MNISQNKFNIKNLIINIKDEYWKDFIINESKKEYFKNIIDELNKEEGNFYPKAEDIFNAFVYTPYENVKVVLIGQDPYHEENQAHGLSFSVKNNKTPKSLQNIFKELKDDLNIERQNPDLSDWAKQGVLLLNATLTVRKHEANSHSNIGWQDFTDNVIKELSKKKNIAYILLGNFAIQKCLNINETDNLVIKTSHPSFFSANKGFFGSKIFSRVNKYLKKINKDEIKW